MSEPSASVELFTGIHEHVQRWMASHTAYKIFFNHNNCNIEIKPYLIDGYVMGRVIVSIRPGPGLSIQMVTWHDGGSDNDFINLYDVDLLEQLYALLVRRIPDESKAAKIE
jgi:hypothetical protein